MEIEEGIRHKLISTLAVTALLGSRIYPVQAPQGTPLPLAIYSEASQRTERGLAGVINLNSYSMRLDVYAETYGSAKQTRRAIKDALNRYRGTVGAGGELTVRGVYDETSDDGVEAPIVADEFGIFRAGLDLAIHFGTT